VEVKHPRNSLVQLVIRFDQDLPPSPRVRTRQNSSATC
jgi:hypothetical protein